MPFETVFFRRTNLDLLSEELNEYIKEHKIHRNDIIKIYFNTVVTSKKKFLRKSTNETINTVMLVHERELNEEEREEIEDSIRLSRNLDTYNDSDIKENVAPSKEEKERQYDVVHLKGSELGKNDFEKIERNSYDSNVIYNNKVMYDPSARKWTAN